MPGATNAHAPSRPPAGAKTAAPCAHLCQRGSPVGADECDFLPGRQFPLHLLERVRLRSRAAQELRRPPPPRPARPRRGRSRRSAPLSHDRPHGAAERGERLGQHRFVAGEPVEVVGQFRRRGVPGRRVLLQALVHDRFQFLRHLRAQDPHPVRLGRLDLGDHRAGVFALERRPTGQRVVERGPQPVDVCSRRNRRAGRLLRSQEARCTDRPVPERQSLLAVRPLGQPEVGQLRIKGRRIDDPCRIRAGVRARVRLGASSVAGHRAFAATQKHVTRLDVAVDDPAFVGRLRGPRDGSDECRGGVRGQRAVRVDEPGERAPRYELHRVVRRVVVEICGKNGDDVRVVQFGQHPDFGLEAVARAARPPRAAS